MLFNSLLKPLINPLITFLKCWAGEAQGIQHQARSGVDPKKQWNFIPEDTPKKHGSYKKK